MTTFRAACGTHLGMRLHQDHGEAPCGQCLVGEAWRRLLPEAVPSRPRPWRNAPVSAEQGASNAARLLAAVDEPDLRVVDGGAA